MKNAILNLPTQKIISTVSYRFNIIRKHLKCSSFIRKHILPNKIINTLLIQNVFETFRFFQERFSNISHGNFFLSRIIVKHRKKRFENVLNFKRF